MTESKVKKQSLLVQSVLELDAKFNELNRLGERIEEIDLVTDDELKRAQDLINRFAECGIAVSEKVIELSTRLVEARERAEATAKAVAAKATRLQERNNERQKRFDEFRQLGEKVRSLSAALSSLKSPESNDFTDNERAQLTMRLTELELQIQPLIEEAQTIKKEAQNSQMRMLERDADSLGQSLLAISKKLSVFTKQETGLPQ